MKIEYAFINDFQNIFRIQKKAFVQEAEIYKNYSIEPLTQTYEEMVLECSSKFILKAVIDDRIVGSARAVQTNAVCQINKIIVLPKYQCQGIGTALLNKIESCFPKAKKFKIETGAKSQNNIKLYQKLGYRIVKKAVFHDNVEAVFMEKQNHKLQ